jgi:hypothetical protein
MGRGVQGEDAMHFLEGLRMLLCVVVRGDDLFGFRVRQARAPVGYETVT